MMHYNKEAKAARRNSAQRDSWASRRRRLGITETSGSISTRDLDALRRLYRQALEDVENLMAADTNGNGGGDVTSTWRRQRRHAVADLFNTVDHNMLDNLRHLRELHLAALRDDTLASDEEERYSSIIQRVGRRNALMPDNADCRYVTAAGFHTATVIANVSGSDTEKKWYGAYPPVCLPTTSDNDAGSNLHEQTTRAGRRRNAVANILDRVDSEWLQNLRPHWKQNQDIDDHVSDFSSSGEEADVPSPDLLTRRGRRNAVANLLATVDPGWLDNVRNQQVSRSVHGNQQTRSLDTQDTSSRSPERQAQYPRSTQQSLRLAPLAAAESTNDGDPDASDDSDVDMVSPPVSPRRRNAVANILDTLGQDAYNNLRDLYSHHSGNL